MKLVIKTAVSAMIMACSVGSNVVFAESGCTGQADPTACYSKVMAYGDVSVAEDSVNSWGVWKEFAQPAAGPTPMVSLLVPAIPSGPVTFNDSSDFVPQIEVPVLVGVYTPPIVTYTPPVYTSSSYTGSAGMTMTVGGGHFTDY
ncbi:MAG: hypothetical protein GY770_14875 [Aestuariibacter sp.]|nr:hypothetical protein [Aestuariibacter sp.]